MGQRQRHKKHQTNLTCNILLPRISLNLIEIIVNVRKHLFPHFNNPPSFQVSLLRLPVSYLFDEMILKTG